MSCHGCGKNRTFYWPGVLETDMGEREGGARGRRGARARRRGARSVRVRARRRG